MRALKKQYDPHRLIAKARLGCSPGLPIGDHWDELKEALEGHQVVIVAGETGSGKSTQLPKVCLEAGLGRRGRIVCTQPRRIAAITVAERLMEELGPVGPLLVGWRIRFHQRVSPEARVVYCTDGLLLTELQKDPELRAYEVVMVDEAHERSINIDFLLGVLRRLVRRRRELKVIITSATIDTERFSQAFDDAPVFRVEGRTYPVETIYSPVEQDSDMLTAIEAGVELARAEDPLGNILVFLPTEKDIIEAVGHLSQRFDGLYQVLPMFGRLSSGQQRRIFAPSRLPKLVVATNIAETSITVPGISCVIDSGLARIARYNVRSRTKSLPVSPISQASADQRAGRAGRVRPGICIRLYSEEDYLSRPRFTPPEIMRSNLAEVVLRLKELGLGAVERFPFVDPPSPRAVRDGVATLKELGALDRSGRLTRQGRTMARLPLDPRISRMLLEAARRGALREMVVIAAALSIQDPREFPLNKEDAARSAHARLIAPFMGDSPTPSDFMAFLYLWRAYEAARKEHSRSRLRRFCQDHFLSYRRMEEWADIVRQISRIVEESRLFRWNQDPADYRAIHSSILAGFLSNIAVRQERKSYKGARGRELLLFPGSLLYRSPPKWIVAAELVETSRLFARICAKVEPDWIEEVAGGLVKRDYSDPVWDPRRGEVMARERVTLYGLTLVEGRRYRFSRVDPQEARTIFIRDGLAQCAFVRKIPAVEHNRGVMAEVEALEERMRSRDIMVEPEALMGFFHQGLATLEEAWNRKRRFRKPRFITGEADLLDAVRCHGDDSPIRLSKEALMKRRPGPGELELFPGHVLVRDREIPLEYTFAPGTPEDGVTAVIPLDLLFEMEQQDLQWVVPGLMEEQIVAYLKLLPKRYRRALVPIPASGARLCRWLREQEERPGLQEAVRRGVRHLFDLVIPPEEMPSPGLLPSHLRVRLRVVDSRGKTLAQGWEVERLQQELAAKGGGASLTGPGWSRLRKRHERTGITSIEDLPERLAPVEGPGGARAYPALVLDESRRSISLRLMATLKRAGEESRPAQLHLVEKALAPEFDHLVKHALPRTIPKTELFALGGERALRMEFYRFLLEAVVGPLPPLSGRVELSRRCQILKGRIWGAARPLVAVMEQIILERQATVNLLTNLTKGLAYSPKLQSRFHDRFHRRLQELCGPHFLRDVDLELFVNLPRYIKGLRIRMERCYSGPSKDRQKAARLSTLLQRMEEVRSRVEMGHAAKSELHQARRELEEEQIKLFAPELGTPSAIPSLPWSKAADGV